LKRRLVLKLVFIPSCCQLLTIAGASLSGFQSPYTPPSAVHRAPPTPIFSTPQREPLTAGTAATTTQTPQSAGQQATTRVETPKVGGKWTHPALHGIEKEYRKFVFGEEDLKRLVVNVFLLYSMWWMSYKVEEMYVHGIYSVLMCSDVFDGIVRFVKYSPRVALGVQIIAWSFRSLFMYNIVQSLLPLLRPKSRPLTNIPLTPAQRELIGLDKSGISSWNIANSRHHSYCDDYHRDNHTSTVQSIPIRNPSLSPSDPISGRLSALRLNGYSITVSESVWRNYDLVAGDVFNSTTTTTTKLIWSYGKEICVWRRR